MTLFGKKTRYEEFLEQENARLRQENRALLNVLLQRSGLATVEEATEPRKEAKPERTRPWTPQWMRRREMDTAQAARDKAKQVVSASQHDAKTSLS